MSTLLLQETSPETTSRTFNIRSEGVESKEKGTSAGLGKYLIKKMEQRGSFAFSIDRDPFIDAKLAFRVARNQSAAKNASALVFLLEQIVRNPRTLGAGLPSLRCMELDDGSLNLEWIFSDSRLGFNIMENWNESSWFLATSRKKGGVIASGLLHSTNPRTLAGLILAVINSHYQY